MLNARAQSEIGSLGHTNSNIFLCEYHSKQDFSFWEIEDVVSAFQSAEVFLQKPIDRYKQSFSETGLTIIHFWTYNFYK